MVLVVKGRRLGSDTFPRGAVTEFTSKIKRTEAYK